MPYKIVEINGKRYAEVNEDDKAIFVHPDGTETPFDADGATSRIAALNKEDTARRHENNDLKRRLAAFEGIEDAEAARKAMETIANLGSGEMKTAAQVAEIKEAARKAAEDQVRDAQRKAAEELQRAAAERDELRNQLHQEKIGGGFARSKFIADKVAVPPEFMERFFGQNFKIEEGKVVAYDGSGAKLYSKARPGELADMDEALEQLVLSYPNKDHILKGAGGGSGGGQGASDRGGLSKEAFDKLDPVAKMNISRGIRPGPTAGSTGR